MTALVMNFRRVLRNVKSTIPASSSVSLTINTRKCHSQKDCTVKDYYDIVIVGGGMVGTTCAATLAINKRLEDKSILLLEGSKRKKYEFPEQYSNRVVALNKQTRILLSSIGAWKDIEKFRCAPVKKMQIWDACSDAVITFNEDLYDTEVAFIVENDLLVHAVSERLSESASAQTLYETKVDKVLIPTRHAETSKITLNSGREIEARLLIGADGARSAVRDAMGIQYVSGGFDQSAIVATVKLSEPTSNVVAWQRFLPTGPVAILPLNDSQSSLVWSTSTSEARRLLQMTEEEFTDSLNDAIWRVHPQSDIVRKGMDAFQQLLSTLSLNTGVTRQLPPSISGIVAGTRASFPLGYGHAVDYVKPGVALVGDAAHKVHPLAGQGVNLGFGDVVALAKCLDEGAQNGAILGDVMYLQKYEAARQLHNTKVLLFLNVLHHYYNYTLPPLVLGRSIKMQLANAVPELKRFMMRNASS